MDHKTDYIVGLVLVIFGVLVCLIPSCIAKAETNGTGPLPPEITTPCNAQYIDCAAGLQSIAEEQNTVADVCDYLGAPINRLAPFDARRWLATHVPFPSIAACYANLAACEDTEKLELSALRDSYLRLKKALKKVR